MNDSVILTGCIIVDEYGRILVLHQTVDDIGHWEIPGGQVDEEEAPESAAARITTEKLGVGITLTKVLGSDSFEEEEQTYIYYWFQATLDSELGIMESDSFDDFDYVDIEDLPSLSLPPSMLLLQEKLLTGDIVL